MEIFMSIIEIIGTVSFAVSGAMIGLKKQMDIFGVIILGLTASVGGGIIRDILLGAVPPQIFENPIYAAIAATAAVIVSVPWVRRIMLHNQKLYDMAMLITDTMGLGVFTVMGVCITYEIMGTPGYFLTVSIGVITGCGGGVMRDIFAGDTPYIFKKHIYACAALIGAAVCICLWEHIGEVYAMIAGMAVIVVIRFLSAYFRWNLPKPEKVSAQQ